MENEIFDEKKKPVCYINHYQCPECNYFWQDEWTAQCDDECPNCGKRHISPFYSEEF